MTGYSESRPLINKCISMAQVDVFSAATIFWVVKMRIKLNFGNIIVRICTNIWQNLLRICNEVTSTLSEFFKGLCKFWPLSLSDIRTNTSYTTQS